MTVGGQLQPYAPGTLAATLEDGGMIAVRRIMGGGLLAMADASTFVDCDGSPFADGAAALAYLQGEFARRPSGAPACAARASSPAPATRTPPSVPPAIST